MGIIAISGASRGIGRSIALRFAKEGWNLALCSKTPEHLDKLTRELQDLGHQGTVLARVADFEHRQEVLDFAEAVNQSFDHLDVLVNNAGIFIPGSIVSEPEGALERMMNINLFSTYHLTRALLPCLQRSQQAHIFNMASTASLKAYPNGGAYSISKFALLGFSKNLREELKPRRIRVTSICPGPTRTDSWAGYEAPEERMMKPEDLAEIIWTSYHLSAQTVVEDILLRPMEGDIPAES